jgi:hypothetical protein
VNKEQVAKELIVYWRRQARILIAASKDDGTSQEQRDLSIGLAKGLRFAAKQLAKHTRIGVDHE